MTLKKTPTPANDALKNRRRVVLMVFIGILFGVFTGFSTDLMDQNRLIMAITAGFSTVFLLAGVSLWVNSSLKRTSLMARVSHVGLPLFIMAETFAFISVFASYGTLRMGDPEWQPELNPIVFGIMTLSLIASALTSRRAIHNLSNGDLGGFNLVWIVSIILGTVFLGGTGYGWMQVNDTGTFSTVLFTLTGFFAAHLVAGLAAFIGVLIPALSGRTHMGMLNAVSVYWQFLVIIWLATALQLYL